MKTFGGSPKIIMLAMLLLLASGQAASQSRATSQQSRDSDEMYIGHLAGSPAASLARHLALKSGAGRFSPHLARLLERRDDLSGFWVNETLNTPTQGQSGAAPSQSALAAQSEGVPRGFSFVDLGTLGGPDTITFPFDLNERGQVVGACFNNDDGRSQAFLWDNGVMVDLGGVSPYSVASKINNRGQVLGGSFVTEPFFEIRYWVWDEGVITEISQFGHNILEAIDINERGQVSGTFFNGHQYHPFVWEGGVPTDLGSLGGFFSEGFDINDRGQVVGSSETADGHEHPFLWDNGVMTDLGAINGSAVSYALLINERGQVVGRFVNFNPVRSDLFLWDHGEATALGTRSGFVPSLYGLNEKGQIVGGAFPVPGGPLHGFFWDNEELTDLTLPGGTSSLAWAINQSSQVVGSSRTASGESHAFLWDRGVLTDLGIPPGGVNSRAELINERGQIVGEWVTASGEVRAFILTPTQ